VRAAPGAALNIALRAVRTAVGLIGSAVAGMVSDMTAAVAGIPGIFLRFVGAIGTAAASVGSRIVSGIKEGIGSAAGFIADVASSLANGIKNVVDRVVLGPLRAALRTMARGLANVNIPGVGRAFDAASRAIEGVADAISLARGGIVSGPILAYVGDAPSPEVVSPLDDLTRILRQQFGDPRRDGRVSTVEVTVDARTTIAAPVYGVDDLDRYLDERDRKMQEKLAQGILRVL
jgi:hypothetical protein